MNVSSENISKPTYAIVQPIYENLVSILLGVSREELQQPVFAAIDSLEFPELHDESIPVIAFVSHVTKLLNASGIKDFSLRDLYSPDAERLRRNLSAIINFAKFREEKLIAFAELQEHIQALLLAKDEALAATAELEAQLAELEEAAAVEQPEVERTMAEAEAVFAENTALNKQQGALNSEVRARKAAAHALAEESAALRTALAEARHEEEFLRSQVVQSPQRAAAALAALSAALEGERSAAADAERRGRDAVARAAAVARAEKEVSKIMAAMDELQTELARKKEVSRAVKALRAERTATEHGAEEAAAALAAARRAAAALEERIQRLEAQIEVQREAAEGNIEEQLRDREALEAEAAANAAKVAENEAAVRVVQRRLAEVTEEGEARRAAVLQQYRGLLDQVRAYHNELIQAMQGGTGSGLRTTGRDHAVSALR